MPDLTNHLEFLLTAGTFLVCAVIVGVLAWLERRPRTSLTPRLIPTTPLMLIFGFIGLLALVHLLNMYGIHTGRRSKI
jgi:hypothetical protein